MYSELKYKVLINNIFSSATQSVCKFSLPLSRIVSLTLLYFKTYMEFVKKFTQARFLKTKFYPKVRKSQ